MFVVWYHGETGSFTHEVDESVDSVVNDIAYQLGTVDVLTNGLSNRPGGVVCKGISNDLHLLRQIVPQSALTDYSWLQLAELVNARVVGIRAELTAELDKDPNANKSFNDTRN